jgi:L-gulonolactone oxidase
LKVNYEKQYVVSQAGITLHDLHAKLANHGLALINVPSVSDLTLAGIVTTATHGSGINFGVLSTHVLALTLLLADGSRVTCSRLQNPELFLASICGLGSTGLILTIQLEVEHAFRLREIRETFAFDYVMRNLDHLVFAAEHVRFWWFPATGLVCVSSLDRTRDVVKFFCASVFFLTHIHSQLKRPVGGSWSHSLLGYHLMQLILFVARFVFPLNVWAGYLASWLVHGRTVGIDDSHTIFNVDCRVCTLVHSIACVRFNV